MTTRDTYGTAMLKDSQQYTYFFNCRSKVIYRLPMLDKGYILRYLWEMDPNGPCRLFALLYFMDGIYYYMHRTLSNKIL